jgi:hypothetical protein
MLDFGACQDKPVNMVEANQPDLRNTFCHSEAQREIPFDTLIPDRLKEKNIVFADLSLHSE